MRNVDFIVVGLGIAGISFCEQLEKDQKSFLVIDAPEAGATARSGGILNPTVLKRFTAAWNASLFYPVAVDFYRYLSKKLKKEIYNDTPILRILSNTEEQNNWVVASEKIGLKNFLRTELVKNTNPNISAPFGFGKVVGTARILKDDMLALYKMDLLSKELLLNEYFEYENLQIMGEGIVYKHISAKKIIFCEGPRVMSNPFFPSNIIIPNRGEYLIISSTDLKLKELLKGPLYIIPLGDDLYKVGATYDRDQVICETTSRAREDILEKLQRMISCSYEVIGQTSGIRPTTRDRKPLLGHFNENPQVVFFNGLGTHGLMMAPYLSEVLYNNLKDGSPIPKEMDIRRVL